jgi:hypothetical protein
MSDKNDYYINKFEEFPPELDQFLNKVEETSYF